jgi:hypothetical protein
MERAFAMTEAGLGRRFYLPAFRAAKKRDMEAAFGHVAAGSSRARGNGLSVTSALLHRRPIASRERGARKQSSEHHGFRPPKSLLGGFDNQGFLRHRRA